MRKLLFATILTVSAGCQALGDGHALRIDEKSSSETTARRRPSGLLQGTLDSDAKRSAELSRRENSKGLSDNVKSASAWQETNDSSRVPPLGSDVLLVPKTVFIPYAAHAPNSTVRLTDATHLVQLPDDGARLVPATLKNSAGESTQQLLEMYKKLNDRLDSLERKVAEKNGTSLPPLPNSGPSEIVPTNPLPAPIKLSNQRRPMLPSCEPLRPCEVCPLPPLPLSID